MADIQLTDEEKQIYRDLKRYYDMGDVATEDVEQYITDAIRMRGTYEGTSRFADEIKALVDAASELPEVDGAMALERISEKLASAVPRHNIGGRGKKSKKTRKPKRKTRKTRKYSRRR